MVFVQRERGGQGGRVDGEADKSYRVERGEDGRNDFVAEDFFFFITIIENQRSRSTTALLAVLYDLQFVVTQDRDWYNVHKRAIERRDFAAFYSSLC